MCVSSEDQPWHCPMSGPWDRNPGPHPVPRTKSADSGSVQGSDDIHLTRAVRGTQHADLRITNRWNSRGMETCKQFVWQVFYHRTKHSHHCPTPPRPAAPFREITGSEVHFFQKQSIPLGAPMKNLFFATSVLLLRLYLSITAAPQINDTKKTKPSL